MSTVMQSNRTKAFLQFLALYFISALLIFIVAATIWRNRGLVQNNQAASVEQQAQQTEQLQAATAAEIEQYKDAIAVRNHVIDSLNAQLSLRLQQNTVPVQTNVTSNDGEWKQKYSSLKTSYDKALERESSLKAAYKTVSDDNKRLLQQIQSLKGSRN